MRAWTLLLSILVVDGFVTPPRPHFARKSGSFGGSFSHNGNEPPSSSPYGSTSDDSLLPSLPILWMNQTEVRGGSNPQETAENVVKGTQATLASSANFWSKTFASLSQQVTAPFRAFGRQVSSRFQSKEKKKEAELLEKLQTMPVRAVTVPNSTVLPPDVVQLAAKRSGVLGNPLRTDRVQDFAAALKRWYTRKGYVLHSVTGATLQADTGTAEIAVQEPMTAYVPVGITFCKEMVVDSDTGELLTFRQYKDKHAARRTFGFDKISKADVNTTYVPTTGRTNPSRIAAALGLKPGRPFQWDGSRWRSIVGSGIFAQVLNASPRPMGDGTVQLQILATEAPPRHLEYGVGRSLYTGSWEGELEFEHMNLLGGGETLGVNIRRGAKDAEPSVRLSYSDGKFGMAGGYDVEVFSDYIGDEKKTEAEEGEAQQVDYDHDALVDRRGLSFRIRNPIDQRVLLNSVAKASIERTSTKHGLHENIGSTTLSVGPFIRQLPYDARSNVDCSFTAGTRMQPVAKREVVAGEEAAQSDSLLSNQSFLPYSAVTATTRQVFPLINTSASSDTGGRRPVILALRHSLTTSTPNLPRHEAKAQGISSEIRGCEPNDRIASCLRGTTELRVPVNLPIKQTRQDASLVVFGDWLIATQDASSPFFRKSSAGIGVRKSFQGIPLKFDVTYSKEMKLKTSFGLGRDFDV